MQIFKLFCKKCGSLIVSLPRDDGKEEESVEEIKDIYICKEKCSNSSVKEEKTTASGG